MQNMQKYIQHGNVRSRPSQPTIYFNPFYKVYVLQNFTLDLFSRIFEKSKICKNMYNAKNVYVSPCPSLIMEYPNLTHCISAYSTQTCGGLRVLESDKTWLLSSTWSCGPKYTCRVPLLQLRGQVSCSRACSPAQK